LPLSVDHPNDRREHFAVRLELKPEAILNRVSRLRSRDNAWQELGGARVDFSGLQCADNRQVAHGFQSTLSAWRLARGFKRDLELETLGTLKVSYRDLSFHDTTLTVTSCGRICFNGRKLNLSHALAEWRFAWAMTPCSVNSARLS